MAVSVVCPPEEAALYAEAGYLVFEEPARAVRAMAALRGFAVAFARPERGPVTTGGMPKILPGTAYHEASAKALLADAGVASPAERLALKVEVVASIAEGLRYPLALKIVSRGVLASERVRGTFPSAGAPWTPGVVNAAGFR